MFKFLKDKLKKAVDTFTKGTKEEAEVEVEEAKLPEKEKKPEKEIQKKPKKEKPKKKEKPVDPDQDFLPDQEPLIEEKDTKPLEDVVEEAKEEQEQLQEERDAKPVEDEKSEEPPLIKPIESKSKKVVVEGEKQSEILEETKAKAEKEDPKSTKEPVQLIEEPNEEPEVIEPDPEPVTEDDDFLPKHEIEEEPEEKPKEKKSFFSKLFKKKKEPKEADDDFLPEQEPLDKEEEPETDQTTHVQLHTRDEPIQLREEPKVEVTPEEKPSDESKEVEGEKKSFFSKVTETFTTIKLSEDKFDELFWDLEVSLLENNVALSVIDKLKEDLKDELTTGRTARGSLEQRIKRRLQESITEILSVKQHDLHRLMEMNKPLVIAGIGINGSGKTTSLAKLAHHFKKQNKKVVFAACDTFRAAAIQQLEEHAKKLDVPIIKQDYGADAAAVAYDAIEHAKAKHLDVVLVDTAGRLHSNTNLMDELAKLVRVAKPHLKVFVGEATTGNDCLEQASQFDSAVGIDAIILTKSDVDGAGGTAVSASHVTKKPILFLGTGQDYEDLVVFDKEKIVEELFSD